MFAGVNTFWTRLSLVLARAVRQGQFQMSSEMSPNCIYAQELKLYYYYYHCGGH